MTSCTWVFLPGIFMFIMHQIFFARAIGLNTSRDAVKTGEYQMKCSPSDIPQFPNFAIYVCAFSFHPNKLLK